MNIRLSLTVVLFLFAIASMCFAQSQPPPPRPPEISKEQQNEPTPKQTESKNKKRDASYRPTVVKEIETTSTNLKEANQTKHSDEKSPHDWTVFDLLLVIFNGVLAVSTSLLWWSTHKLWKAAQGQRDDLRDSIKEAVRSADAMDSIAKSMAENVTRMKEVLERQKDFAEIQLRAYLTINPGA